MTGEADQIDLDARTVELRVHPTGTRNDSPTPGP